MRDWTGLWAWPLFIAFSIAQDEPKALVIPPSQHFEGNDGPWSTFDVRVGEPEQYLRVLVSTASPHALVPVTEACSDAVFDTVPPDCAVSRGKLFNVNDSSTWQELGIFGLNENGIGLGGNLGYEARVQFGLDNLGIGLNGPSLENQTIGGIATPEPFYLGIFGLNNQPLNFTTLGNHPSSSFLTTLKDQGKIPSLSWSYTAGAKYRLKQVYGQLIFSGYDTSRFKENAVSFTMADDITRDLVAILQSISYSGSQSTTLLSDPIDVMIDSTDPNIWLPEEACDAFEDAFGLTLDQESGLYLVNSTHRNRLLDSNAEVSFRLSDVRSGGETVTIVLPYAAFDLTAEPPLVKTTSHYFPLKRANSSNQYTLGRTFLQEAYLTANYQDKTFNVSSCTFSQGAVPTVVTIPSSSSDSPSSSSSNNKTLSGGTLAGIIIGSILGFLLLAGILAVFILRKRRKWIGHGFAVAAVHTSETNRRSSSIRGVNGMAAAVLSGSGKRRGGSSPGDGDDSSVPFSADHIGSASAGSANRSRSTVGQVQTRPGSAGDGNQVQELDGREMGRRPTVELDGTTTGLPVVVESPGGVFELDGRGVGSGGEKGVNESGSGTYRVSALVEDERVGPSSPPSPMTATGTWDGSANGNGETEGVSPDGPVYYRTSRPF